MRKSVKSYVLKILVLVSAFMLMLLLSGCRTRVTSNTDVIGKVTKAAANATGLKEGTPVICGTTDTVMEVFASGAVKKGQITSEKKNYKYCNHILIISNPQPSATLCVHSS